MTTHGDMTRRRFLVLAAFGASLAAWPSFLGPESLPSRRSSSRAERLVGCLRHRDSARAVGAAYLDVTPSEAEVEPLVEAIAAGLGGAGVLRMRTDEIRARLAGRIDRDFEEDATVCLKGWVVSRTEARLYGLAALL